MEPWYIQDNDRYELELRALKERQIKFEIDHEAKAQKILRLRLQINGDNPNFDLPDKQATYNLVAVYPDLFPFFRPIVFGYELSLPRHFDPIGKGLCLLPRATEFWLPKTTLAQHLHEQLALFFTKGSVTDQEVLDADAAEQAEPESVYYPGEDIPVLFDTSSYGAAIPNQVERIGKIRVGIPNEAQLPTRMAVLKAYGNKDVLVSETPNAIQSHFPKQLNGVAYRLPIRPPYGDALQDYNWLKQQLGNQAKDILPSYEIRLKDGSRLRNVIALNFPEETGPGRQEMVGWLFLIRYDHRIVVGEGKKQRFGQVPRVLYAKAARLSGADLTVRIPKLASLANKTIAIAGLGALGAPSAIEFARSRVGSLRVLDKDIVDPATSVRWPLGISVGGLRKVEVIMAFIEQNYPATKTNGFHFTIGRIRVDGKSPVIDPNLDKEAIESFLNGASLIFDATAELGIMHYLSEEARRRNIPYVGIYATEGGQGGVVMRFVPGKTEGCWMCMRWWQKEEKLPKPSADPSGKIQGFGCGDLTFTGAGFDLQQVALAGVRLAVSTICGGEAGSYPEFETDIGILSQIDENGKAIFPTWSAHKLARHPKCPYCNAHEG